MLGAHGLNFAKGAEEIRSGLSALVDTYEAKVEALVAESTKLLAEGGAERDPRRLFEAAFHRLADADGHASLASAELTLPALVSGDREARAASSEAKKALQQMWARAHMRADLHACLRAARRGAQTPEEERLAQQVLCRLEQAGAALPCAEGRAQVAALDARCAALAFEIEQNINEDCTEVRLTETELAGCGADFVSSLPMAAGSEPGAPPARACSVKAPVLVPITRRAVCPEARRKMMEASQRRCMGKNGPLLLELLGKRHAAARALGFASHAERMLSTKMAETPQRARHFCEDMLARLAPQRDAELRRLGARKACDGAGRQRGQKRGADGSVVPEEDGCPVEPWDVPFYSDLLKREELCFDDEKTKEFFPLVATIDKLLAVYSEMLGFTFSRSATLPTWHEEVAAFEVRRREGGELVGHMYLDQHPRAGKFGHQMVVPLAPSFVDTATGRRCVPACANISNFPRPQGDRPALLRWDEMKTVFHELGHVMHCLCATTRFSMLSWAWPMVPWPGGVEQDFLELPSMALEKFANEPALLNRVAQHYSAAPEAPRLGEDTVKQIQQFDKWMVGTSQSRYFAMALFDLLAHSQAPPYAFDGEEGLSVEQLFARVLEKHTRLRPLPDVHPCASWYHLVIGYDAGYYGYGWCDVYGADTFAAMLAAPAGPLGAETGARLRDELLGPCAARPGGALLRAFLGREPSADAWCARTGVAAGPR